MEEGEKVIYPCSDELARGKCEPLDTKMTATQLSITVDH
jgi:hypothetical protein